MVTVTYGEPIDTTRHDQDGVEITFSLKVKYSVEGPGYDNIVDHRISVFIDRRLKKMWGYDYNDFIKVLFIYARKHVDPKLKKNILSEHEHVELIQGVNVPKEREFDPAKLAELDNPNGFFYPIDTEQEQRIGF